jgi:hypothetical protein
MIIIIIIIIIIVNLLSVLTDVHNCADEEQNTVSHCLSLEAEIHCVLLAKTVVIECFIYAKGNSFVNRPLLLRCLSLPTARTLLNFHSWYSSSVREQSWNDTDSNIILNSKPRDLHNIFQTLFLVLKSKDEEEVQIKTFMWKWNSWTVVTGRSTLVFLSLSLSSNYLVPVFGSTM